MFEVPWTFLARLAPKTPLLLVPTTTADNAQILYSYICDGQYSLIFTTTAFDIIILINQFYAGTIIGIIGIKGTHRTFGKCTSVGIRLTRPTTAAYEQVHWRFSFK